MKKTITVDITPTWRSLIGHMMLVLETSENQEALTAVRAEMESMARAADLYVESQKAKPSDACPVCDSSDELDCHDMDVDGTDIISSHYCGCGAQWQSRWSMVEVYDIDESDCATESDMQSVIDDDNRDRAMDVAIAMRENGI